jgi:hypothetical protein
MPESINFIVCTALTRLVLAAVLRGHRIQHLGGAVVWTGWITVAVVDGLARVRLKAAFAEANRQGGVPTIRHASKSNPNFESSNSESCDRS